MPKVKKGKRKVKRKRRRIRLTPEAKLAKKHMSDIRTTFTNSGFEHITATRDTNIDVAGRTGELDGIFMFENIMVIVEDVAQTSQRNIVKHLRQKHEFSEHLNDNIEDLFDVLKSEFPKFRGYMQRHKKYQWQEFKIKHVYASLYDIDKKYEDRYRDIFAFLDYSYLRYFLTLSRTIHKTARFELLKFLDFKLKDIGSHKSADEFNRYEGLLLPNTSSSFPSGYTIVSFLVDPEMLLKHSYVLRADSWRDSDCLYQRLLIKSKIKNMREYLACEKRVYVNNIITTLPNETEIKDENGKLLNPLNSTKIERVFLGIPKKFNTIGIIDGQHRVFSYHHGTDPHDKKIEVLRGKQHLLVTGIIYPRDVSQLKKQKFEAQLFLEINDKQKRVKGDLKQAIALIVKPHSAVAISKAVIGGLAETGPLVGRLESHFYDTGKLKTTSIVSYGMKYIVGLDGEHSFYRIWRGTGKTRIKQNKGILTSYINYCVLQINMFIEAFKENLPNNMWTSDQKVSRVLTTTTINGLIYCLRRLIENKKINSFESYKKSFKKLNINFKTNKFEYKSSHWKSLGDEIYKQCFK